MTPDYTKLLERIVELLNRPGPPTWQPWVLATFSALFGVIVGALGRSIEPWFTDISRRSRMRRVLYTDIDFIYAMVQSVQPGDASRPDMYKSQLEELKRALTFQDEKYLNDNRDVFHQLSEHAAAAHLYSECHRILDEPMLIGINSDRFLWLVDHYLYDGTLREKYFRKYVGHKAEAFIRNARRRHQESLKKVSDAQDLTND
jgi:hypothetical protein